MATRFYFSSLGTLPSLYTPDAGWEQTAQPDTIGLEVAGFLSRASGTTQTDVTIPITTTQDILMDKCITPALSAQTISGNFSLVAMLWESSSNNNATLACVVRLISASGAAKATLFSTFNTDTEFNIAASKSTRIVNAVALSSTACDTGDRIIVEIGAHAAAPTSSGVGSSNMGYAAGTADYALTSGLTTSLNPWVEFSQTLSLPNATSNNYQFVKVGDGMSTSEKIR